MSIVNPPLVPVGLRDLVKNFTKDLLNKQPPNIPEYAVEYFENMLPQNPYKVREYELHGYGESITKTRKLNQYPLSAVFAIFPKPLTQIIKDFIKVLLRENPSNLVEFAIKYFRGLREKNEIEEVDYSTYANYINTKKPLTLGSTVRCTCGRILTTVPNIKSIPNNDEPFKATSIILNNNENLPKENSSSDNKEDQDPFGDRIKAVLILQRLYRRSRKNRAERNKQGKLENSLISSNAILASTIKNPNDLNIESTEETINQEVANDNNAEIVQIKDNPDHDVPDVIDTVEKKHEEVIDSDLAISEEKPSEELVCVDQVDEQEVVSEDEKPAQGENLELTEQEQKEEVNDQTSRNHNAEKNNQERSEAEQPGPEKPETEDQEGDSLENENITKSHELEDIHTIGDQVIAKEDTILNNITSQDEDGEKNAAENKENIAIESEEQETDCKNPENDIEKASEEYKLDRGKECINSSGCNSLEEVDEPTLERNIKMEPGENQKIENDIIEQVTENKMLIKEEEETSSTNSGASEGLEVSKDENEQKIELTEIVSAEENKMDKNHESVEHIKEETNTENNMVHVANELEMGHEEGNEMITDEVKENSIDTKEVDNTLEMNEHKEKEEEENIIVVNDANASKDTYSPEKEKILSMKDTQSNPSEEIKEHNIEITEGDAIGNEGSVKNNLEEEDKENQTVQNDIIENVIEKPEEEEGNQLRFVRDLALKGSTEVNKQIKELTETEYSAENEEDNKLRSENQKEKHENRDNDTVESLHEEEEKIKVGSNESEIIPLIETGKAEENEINVDKKEQEKYVHKIEKDSLESDDKNVKREEEGVQNFIRKSSGERNPDYNIVKKTNLETEEKANDHQDIKNNLKLVDDEKQSEDLEKIDAETKNNIKKQDEKVFDLELENRDLISEIESSTQPEELVGNKTKDLVEKGSKFNTEIKDEEIEEIEQHNSLQEKVNNEELTEQTSLDVQEEKVNFEQCIGTAEEVNVKEESKEIELANSDSTSYLPAVDEKDNEDEKTKKGNKYTGLNDSVLEKEGEQTAKDLITAESKESQEENKSIDETTPKQSDTSENLISNKEEIIQKEHNKESNQEINFEEKTYKANSNESIEDSETQKEIVKGSENSDMEYKPQTVNSNENNNLQKNNSILAENTNPTYELDKRENSGNQQENSSEAFSEEEQLLTDKAKLILKEDQNDVESVNLDSSVQRSVDQSKGADAGEEAKTDETKNSINEEPLFEARPLSVYKGSEKIVNNENMQQISEVIPNKLDENDEDDKHIENEKHEVNVSHLKKPTDTSTNILITEYTSPISTEEHELSNNNTENISLKDADVVAEQHHSESIIKPKSISENSSSNDENIEMKINLPAKCKNGCNEDEQVVETETDEYQKKNLENSFTESKSDTFIKEIKDDEPQNPLNQLNSDAIDDLSLQTEVNEGKPQNQFDEIQKSDISLNENKSDINAAINTILNEAKVFVGTSNALGLEPEIEKKRVERLENTKQSYENQASEENIIGVENADVVEPETKKSITERLESTKEEYENQASQEDIRKKNAAGNEEDKSSILSIPTKTSVLESQIEEEITESKDVLNTEKHVASLFNNIDHESNKDNEPSKQIEEINKLKSHTEVVADQDNSDTKSLDNEQKEQINNFVQENHISELKESPLKKGKITKISDDENNAEEAKINQIETSESNTTSKEENFEKVTDSHNRVVTPYSNIETEHKSFTKENNENLAENIEVLEKTDKIDITSKNKNISLEEQKTELETMDGVDKEKLNENENNENNFPGTDEISTELKQMINLMSNVDTAEKAREQRINKEFFYTVGDLQVNEKSERSLDVILESPPANETEINDDLSDHTEIVITSRFIPTEQLYDIMEENSSSTDISKESNGSIDLILGATDVNTPYTEFNNVNEKTDDKQKATSKEKNQINEKEGQRDDIKTLETTEDTLVENETDKFPASLQVLGESSVTEIIDRNATEKCKVDSDNNNQKTDKAQNVYDTLKKTKSTLSKTSDSSSKEDDDTVQIGKVYSSEEEHNQSETASVVHDHVKQTDKILNATNLDEDKEDMSIKPQMKMEKSLENADEDDELAELKNIQPRQSRSLLRSNTDSVMTQPPDPEAFIEAIQNKSSIDTSDDDKSDLDKSFSLEGDIQNRIRENMFACSLSETNSDSFDVVMQQLENAGPIAASDDRNIDTALVDATGTSTDSDSTIVSAVTKIQANTRGYLTRKRLRRESHGNKSSAADEQKASFGNAAINESLEYLVKDAAAKKIQKFMRTMQLFRQKKENNDDDDDEVIIRKTANSNTSSSEHSLAARRMTLQRGDALRNDSLPDDDSSSSGSPKQFTDGKAAKLSVSARSYVNTSVDRRLMWQLIRRNSMPVQIDSDVFRFIPKHLKKRVSSVEMKKKSTNFLKK